MLNGTTTYFVGTYFELSGSTVTKYYYAGSQRIALRTGVWDHSHPVTGTLNFLLGDHLGSASLVTDANSNVISEMRYTAWGEVRYASGNTPTQYQYTGQFSYESQFGLYFYNARWYDSYINHFTQPDTIVPDPNNPQAWDRYAYANNNPLKYTDPSGHRPDDGCNTEGCTPPDERQKSKEAQGLAKLQQAGYDTKCAAGNTAYCSGDPVEIVAFTGTMLIGGAALEAFILGGGAAGAVDAASLASKALYDKALYTCLTSYACAKLMARVTGITLYRVWGRDPDLSPEGFSGPWGSSWTPINPSTISNFRDAAGLPNASNLGRFVSVGKIYDLAGVIIKSADEIPPNPGGLLEYKFVDPALSAVRIFLQNVLGVNPPY